MTYNFNQLLNNGRERVVCLCAGEALYWSQLRQQVFLLRAWLVDSKHLTWILACESTASFMIGLLALIAAKKEILLPPNNLVGTLNDTLQGGQALLTDLEQETILPQFHIPILLAEIKKTVSVESTDKLCLSIDAEQQYIQLCTSGSSGKPKQIRKSLRSLEYEIDALEKLWGQQVKDKYVLSTVSHQHIYGLLFRVLWPLMSQRVFFEENIEYPEQIHTLAQRYSELILISSPAYLKRMAEVLNQQSMQDSVHVLFSSGGPLDRDTSIFYTEFCATTPIEVLGSTETGGIAYRQQASGQEGDWQKFAEVEIKRQSTNGALAIRSPYCFCDDWYEMGDAVELLSDSTFRLLGRIDRIVKLEEKRISLDRMESLLEQSDLVAQAKITVIPGHRTILGGICVLSEVGQLCFAKLKRRAFSTRLREHLGLYFDRVSLPRKWRYVPDFPYNSQGKLTQADLVKLFDEEPHD